MGDLVTAAALQFPAYSGRRSANPLWEQTETLTVAAAYASTGASSSSARWRGRAGGARNFTAGFDLAVLGRDSDHRDADMVDLFALGGGVGIDPSCDRVDRLVLAQGHAGGGVMKTAHHRGSFQTAVAWHGYRERYLVGHARLHADRRNRIRAGDCGVSLFHEPGAGLATEPRPPDMLPGTMMTLLLIVSLVPNYLVSRWAKQQESAEGQIGMVIMSILGIVPLIVRFFEFSALKVNWDTNAYGSVIWTMLGLHTTHIITDLADTVVLAALMFTHHGDNPRRYGDVQDNAMYWNFVVVAWLPIY